MQANDFSQPDEGGAAHAAAGEAKAKASEAAEQAQQKAQQTAAQVQDKVREQIDQRSSQLASQINEQASDLRSVGDSLREQDKAGPAKVADRLAEYAGKVGDYLEQKDSHALLGDAEDFGRRQPLALAAAGLALGFGASRFLKASSAQRFRAGSPAASGQSSLSGHAPASVPVVGGAAQPSSGLPAPAVQGSMPVV
jgi:acyl-CoA reductase-like NAD-dependent aldehyde dehydrogenase